MSQRRAQTALTLAVAKFALIGAGLVWVGGVAVVAYLRWLA
jgi:hypothetical protein